MDDQEFLEVKTGNHKDRDLFATTNERLKKTVLELRSLKDVIIKLEKTIISLDNQSGRLQTKMFWLTMIAVMLAVLQAIDAIRLVLSWMQKSIF